MLRSVGLTNRKFSGLSGKLGKSELAGKARPEKLRLSDSLRHDIIKRLIFHPNGSGILRLLFRSGSTLWEDITFSEIVVVINVRSVRNTSSLILY